MKLVSKITNKVSQGYQGSIDFEKIISRFEYFNKIDEEQSKISTFLETSYLEYVSTVSSPEMAVSLETASLLYFMCVNSKPSKVLDLGSGFSSFVFRKYQQEIDNKVTIYSIDDNENWLQKTQLFLSEENLNLDNIITYQAFIESQLRDLSFDIIFYDLGSMNTRIENLSDILDVGKQSLIVVDDFHKYDYQVEAKKILKNKGYDFYSLRNRTLDVYKRYACLAFKN